jgi:hypothetical protein
MNCHAKIRSGSAKLLPVRESYATGQPILLASRSSHVPWPVEMA